MAAVGATDGRATFNIRLNAGHLSSLHEQSTELLGAHHASLEKMDVELISLATLCERFAPSQIDFLKIGVDGAEASVISGGNWSKRRPAVVIEAVEAGEPIQNWEPTLLQAHYRFACFDGVNRYDIAKEQDDLQSYFDRPINPFDRAVALHRFGHPIAD